MDKKDVRFRIKSIDNAGMFEGWAAVYNNVDLGKDMILPGAFTKTLSAGRKFPVLWQHDPSNIIGACSIVDTREGLQVTGTLELTDPTAQKARTFMQNGILKGLSIGYDTLKSTFVGDVRQLQELRLWEVSIVTFPMNEAAIVTSVKALTDDDRAKHLKAIDDHRRGIDRHQRSIREHLKAMFEGIDDDDASGDDLALLEDEGDLDEEATTKAFVVELRKMWT